MPEQGTERFDDIRQELDAVRSRLRNTIAYDDQDRRLLFVALSALDVARDLLVEIRYGRR